MNWNKELRRLSVEFEHDIEMFYETLEVHAHSVKLLRLSLRDLEKHYAIKPPGVSIDPKVEEHLGIWRRLLP